MRRTEIRFDCGLAHSFLPNFVRNNNFVARSEIDTGDTRHDRQRAIDGKCRDTCWALSTRQRILKYLKWSFRLKLTPLVWAEPAKWAGDHFARQFNGSYTQEQRVKFHWNRICTIYSTAVWAKTDRRTCAKWRHFHCVRRVDYLLLNYCVLQLPPHRLHSRKIETQHIRYTQEQEPNNETLFNTLVVGQWNSEISHRTQCIFAVIFVAMPGIAWMPESIEIRYKLKYANCIMNAQCVRTRNAHARTL